MPGFTNEESKATLDVRFPTSGATDHIAYSADGTSESSAVARTAVGATGWAAATTADPSVKPTSGVLSTATATSAVTLTHYRVMTASTGGTARTEWTAFSNGSKTLAVGDRMEFAAGALQVTLT